MAEITGIYEHERSENMDEYLKAVGIPYIGRKMVAVTSPRLEIEKNGDEWTIRTVTMLRTEELKFTLGVEWEESTPFGDHLKNVANLEGNRLVINSMMANGSKVTREFEVTHEGVVLTMTYDKSSEIAKRFFKRVVAT